MTLPSLLFKILDAALFRIPAALVALCFGVWSFGALWYQGPGSSQVRMALGGVCLALFLIGAIALLLGKGRRFLPSMAIIAVAMLGWWSTIKPSDTRDWSPDVAQKASVTIDGDDIVVKNLRNFVWKDGDTPAQERWETRRYKLSALKTLDLFLSVWDNPNIAHTFVSFGFDGGQQLAFSIEIRKEKGESFDSLAGFFRHYELVLTVADEADVVKVRTNKRNERVSIYRIDVRPENARRLFDQYVGLAQALDTAPQFYSTLTTNCTTDIYKMIRGLAPNDFPLDWRVLVSGHVPEYLYEHDFIDRSRPFAEIKSKADITDKAKAAENADDFSSAIRR